VSTYPVSAFSSIAKARVNSFSADEPQRTQRAQRQQGKREEGKGKGKQLLFLFPFDPFTLSPFVTL
jgi:hypothetical protein